ncbi:MAG: M50 family metallopeptidase [Moraxellaceae bacterium]|nr:M50 family metallopeptidase [Moraxellaceae bacterium]
MQTRKNLTSKNIAIIRLLIIALVTVALFNIPYGYYINYPFRILGTWFHEMGHGLMAILWGGDFYRLEMFANGSGVAYTSSSGTINQAFVSAGGLMSPPIVGAMLILSGRTQKGATIAMNILTFALIISVLIWVSSLFGFFTVGLWGVLIIACAVKLPNNYKPFVIQLLGIQAWASTFLSFDYMFSDNAGSLGTSDTQNIANLLILPYWFWGGLIAIFAIAVLALSLRVTFRR